jgi:hypothetical protein
MWILLLIAVHINDPNDIPARIQIPFETFAECEQAKDNFTYWIKFDQFKVIAQCKKQSL